MGSKRLRAIAVRGTDKLEAKDPEGLSQCQKWFREHYDRNADMIHKFGTPRNVVGMSADGILPTRNFREGSFEHARELSGQYMAETILVDRGTCFACAIACKRDVADPEHGVSSKYGGPEYETIAAGGSLCGIGDLKVIAQFHQLCGQYVMDTISAGVTIVFAMECYENGILTAKDTDGIELRFGNADALLVMTEKMAKREGFGDVLADGVKRAAERIGNGAERFAVHVKGLEVPMHEPRGKQAVALSYATAPVGADHMRAPHDPVYEGFHPSLTDPTDTMARTPGTTRGYLITPKEPCA